MSPSVSNLCIGFAVDALQFHPPLSDPLGQPAILDQILHGGLRYMSNAQGMDIARQLEKAIKARKEQEHV